MIGTRLWTVSDRDRLCTGCAGGDPPESIAPDTGASGGVMVGFWVGLPPSRAVQLVGVAAVLEQMEQAALDLYPACGSPTH